MLFSQGQFNLSGRCCRNVGADQQDTNVLIESTSWCRSNRHVGIDRIDTLVSIEWLRSKGFDRHQKRTKQLLAIAQISSCKTHSTPIPLYFDVEFYHCHMYCQYFLRSVSATFFSFFAFKLSRPVTNHAGTALNCPIFPIC